jgi:hypothetical protein
LTDFCLYHGFTAKVTDPKDPEKEIDNPITELAFAQSKIASFFKESVKSKRANESAEIARSATIESVDAISIK